MELWGEEGRRGRREGAGGGKEGVEYTDTIRKAADYKPASHIDPDYRSCQSHMGMPMHVHACHLANCGNKL